MHNLIACIPCLYVYRRNTGKISNKRHLSNVQFFKHLRVKGVVQIQVSP
jgi:hypothetical protein